MVNHHSQLKLLPPASFGCLLASALVWGIASPVAAQSGEEIFREQCAVCHGEQGQGVELLYEKPLIGDRSVPELTKIINDTMPKEAPKTVVGEQAARVAEYIHKTFYSEQARAQTQSARLELSRLTVVQYENTLADLIGSFRDQGNADRYWKHRLSELRRDDSASVIARKPRGEKEDRHKNLPPHGLQGSYFKSRVVGFRDRVFDRVDPTVNFDFGEGSPDPRLSKEEFAMAWDGSIVAPDTGDYEFIVDTSNGARLFVNDMDVPVIDAVVKSGKQTVHRHSMRLLGGRTYSIRLEYHRSKRAETARVAFKWTRPHHATEVIPERLLVPYRSPEVFIVNTPFPPDDRSTGYVRGTTISKEWNAATTYAALEAAAYISQEINELAGTSPTDKKRDEKLKAFCRKFAERAFRRPLSEEIEKSIIDQQFKKAPDAGTAVKRAILLTLKSPRFLYRELLTPGHDNYDIASRLSFGLWDSLPDEKLLAAARNEKLSDPAERRRQAERMFDDPRTHAKLRGFLHQWLDLDRMHGLGKDREKFPKFDEQLASDLRTSLNLFLDEVVWSDSSDYRDLLLSDVQFLNDDLADYYGFDLRAGAGFREVAFEPGRRAGVLTHPYLMAGFAYSDTSSPIHRGVFIARSVLGRTLNAPPQAFLPIPPDLHPDLTTRERVAMQTSPADCMTCHVMINSLGFSLANFDAVGRFRKQEKGKPIDASGVYTSQQGKSIPLASASDLAEYIATSQESHAAFVEQIFRHVAKQPIQAYGPQDFENLLKSFEEHDFSIKNLMIEAALLSAMPAQPTGTLADEELNHKGAKDTKVSQKIKIRR